MQAEPKDWWIISLLDMMIQLSLLVHRNCMKLGVGNITKSPVNLIQGVL
jgi:hypothetical protein